MALPKKKIPWQDRARLGNTRAFFMTLVEVVISPFDFFEKLEIEDSFEDPLFFAFLNTLYLTGPLLPHIMSWVHFLAFIYILVVTPILIFVFAFIIQKYFLFWEENVDYKRIFSVLAYATPAFILVYVPVVGYGLAVVVFTVLVCLGLMQVHNTSFGKIILVSLIVPFLVLIPYGAVRYANYWVKMHPIINVEVEAQKVLAAVSIAAENYAAHNDGHYPMDSKALTDKTQQYLAHDYCGTIRNSYHFSCDFRSYGYFLKASPQGWQGRGKKTFFVTTGGQLRQQ